MEEGHMSEKFYLQKMLFEIRDDEALATAPRCTCHNPGTANW
jgi:hypothetical protein